MNIKSLAVVVCAAAALASPAAALTFVQDKTFDALAPGISTGFTFDQFDASLGTLDSVTLDFSFLMPDVSSTVTNTHRSQARTYTVGGNATGGVSGAGFTLSNTSATVSKQTASISAGNMGPIGSFGGSGGSSATLATGLGAFIGDGDLAYNFTRAASFTLMPNGQGTLKINPLVGGTAKLTYNYTAPVVTSPTTGAVPEPATWAMMIIGFGAAGAMMRRRRAAFA